MRTNRPFLLSLMAGALFAGCASGGPPGLRPQPTPPTHGEVAVLLADGLSADDASALALVNDPEARAAIMELNADAASEYLDATSLRNPILGGSWRRLTDGSGGANIGLDLSQDFLDLALSPFRRAIARDRLEAAQLRAARIGTESLYNARKAYVAAAASEAVRKTIAVEAEAAEASAELTKRQLAAGTIGELTFSERLSGYHDLLLEAAAAEADAQSHREALNARLGLWGDLTSWSLATELPEPPDDAPDLAALESAAIANRSDMQAAEHQLGALRKDRKLAKVFSWQELGLGVSAERDPGGEWVVGPTVEFAVPLFNWGRARRTKAAMALATAEAQREALALRIRAEVRTKRDAFTNARRVYDFHRTTLLPERERLMALSQENYNGMQIGVFELLAVNHKLLEARNSLTAATRDYWIARLDLEESIGGALVPDAPHAH